MNILSLSLCTIDNLHDSLNIDLDQKKEIYPHRSKAHLYISNIAKFC